MSNPQPVNPWGGSQASEHGPSVVWVGLRGFPGVQGGIETHAEHLCPLLAGLGCQVTAVTRAPYQPEAVGRHWQGVRIIRLWAPRSRGLEALVHTTLAVLYAGLVLRPDILHIQAIGPALLAPVGRMFGLKVVVTHHGPDYDRQKWGAFARWALRLGERWGMRRAHRAIVISRVIQDLVRRKHGVSSTLIPNGAALPPLPVNTQALEPFGLEPRRYVLLVSRLVPEKRHLDLIEAFRRAGLPGWKLAIVGAADHPDAYTRQVLTTAGQAPGVVCTGFQGGAALAQLYAHAGVFVLPSSHEGLPIALLEALSYGVCPLVSDIPANAEVGLPDAHQFPMGDVAALAEKLRDRCAEVSEGTVRHDWREWVAARYSWARAAHDTLAVYRELALSARRHHESGPRAGDRQPQ
ncbi:MAG: glycosyltransferase family 4 protein [Rubrivivax sp.]|nr:glycosyltransferase family 4 protein [Rubrivivax sp.]